MGMKGYMNEISTKAVVSLGVVLPGCCLLNCLTLLFPCSANPSMQHSHGSYWQIMLLVQNTGF